jgi:dihydrolipoamide dehydrogenase
MEFAYVYRAYGTEVTVVEMLDSVLPLEDPEAGEVVARRFQRRGIDVRTSTRVSEVAVHDDGVILSTEADGDQAAIEADVVLVAIGRTPNTEGLGLEEAGIATETGHIAVDSDLRTSVPDVYAIGDVAGGPMLAHKASHDAIHVVEKIAGLGPAPVDKSMIPSCTYCHPQVASVGRTEREAREAGYDVSVSKFPFAAVGKAVAVGERDGWVKIVADAKYGEILGATIVGPEATEIIHEIALARSAELTVDEITATIHAHPTVSEAIFEAALGVAGQPINY